MPALTRFVLAHKLGVVAVWLLLVVVGFATVGTTTNRLTADFSLPGRAGYETNARIAALYHSGGNQEPTLVAVTPPASVTPRSPAAVAGADRIVAAAAAAVPGGRHADTATTGDTALSTTDGHTLYGFVFTAQPTKFGGADPTLTIPAAARSVAPPGWTVGVTGFNELQNGGGGGGGNGALTETLLGGVGALVVLAFVFASFIAVVPMLMAVAAIPTTFLLVLGLTEITSVSFIVEFLIALIGLGVAIDYSLLVVTRWREGIASGMANTDAVTDAMTHAGRAVVFSGLTVAISLLALVVLPVPFLRNVGVAGFFIPLVSIAVATTLLPVILSTIGSRLDWPRIRHERQASRPWSGWARLVLRLRVPAVLVGLAVLVALIVPLTSITLGEPSSPALSQHGAAHDTLTALEAGGVAPGVLEPVEVLATPTAAPALATRLATLPGVATAFTGPAPDLARAGTALVEVLPVGEASTSAGKAAVSAVRHAVAGQPGVLGVGGAGAQSADFISAVYGSFPLMLTLIGVASLVLLSRAFRSIVLAVKAVVFNLLSVAAAYGVMVLVWQQGHGSQAIWSIPKTGAVTEWVPIMVFAFLFGLSMDYEVFILTRMREAYDETGDTAAAVVTGIGRTGRLVTSAALILCLAFLSLSTAPETDIKVLATGLGAGILLDAVVVRCLLVPALVGVLGRWNWWLPGGLARLLRVAPSPVAATV